MDQALPPGMPLPISRVTSRGLISVACVISLGACAADRLAEPEKRVTLSQPFEFTPAVDLPPMLADKFASLAKVDPDRPVSPDSDTQILSLFGREDLIASSSSDYKPTGCQSIAPARPALDEIVRRARQTSVVIINESHERSLDRGFTADVAARLRPLGYSVLALEALSNPTADVPERYQPSFMRNPSLPYFADDDGHYVSEAAYGRLGRRAKALGYRLLPYEDNTHNAPGSAGSGDQRIALREEAQANNLAGFLKSRPGVRMLVHVGYSHAAEVPRADGQLWMAARLKRKTGIDPLTISAAAVATPCDWRRCPPISRLARSI